MKYEIIGTLENVGEVETVGNSGFQKRIIVVNTGGEYPQSVPLELVKDQTSLSDGIPIGAKIRVHFNIRGREWNDRYFVNLQAWKIDQSEQQQQAPPQQQQAPPQQQQAPPQQQQKAPPMEYVDKQSADVEPF